jgi:IS30 family transposase
LVSIFKSEEENLEFILGNKYSQRKIAETIGMSESTVSKELKRNKDMRSGGYRAKLADSKSERRKKEKTKPKRFTESIRIYIEERFAIKFSPEQIAGKVTKEKLPCVSTERIYQMVWKNKEQGRELYKHLRVREKHYRGKRDKKNSIIGKGRKEAILTINDRVSVNVKLIKLIVNNAQQLAEATVKALSDWKPFSRQSHRIMERGSPPISSLQSNWTSISTLHIHTIRGSVAWPPWNGVNENLNGLIRQYIPKKTNFDTVSKELMH